MHIHVCNCVALCVTLQEFDPAEFYEKLRLEEGAAMSQPMRIDIPRYIVSKLKFEQGTNN